MGRALRAERLATMEVYLPEELKEDILFLAEYCGVEPSRYIEEAVRGLLQREELLGIHRVREEMAFEAEEVEP